MSSLWHQLEVPLGTASAVIGTALSVLGLTQKGRDTVRKYHAWRRKRELLRQRSLVEAVLAGVNKEIAPVLHEFQDNGGTGMKERTVKFLDTDFPVFQATLGGRLDVIDTRLNDVDGRLGRIESTALGRGTAATAHEHAVAEYQAREDAD